VSILFCTVQEESAEHLDEKESLEFEVSNKLGESASVESQLDARGDDSNMWLSKLYSREKRRMVSLQVQFRFKRSEVFSRV